MLRMPTEREVQELRVKFPAGTKIRLLEMDDPYAHLKPGDLGMVQMIDDMGQIHVKWETGSTLAVIPGVDRFEKVRPERRPKKGPSSIDEHRQRR